MSDVAIVTGASRGIGRATADALEASGWQVWRLSRTPSIGHWLACDVTDAAQVSAAIGRAFHTSGPPTLLVNCAGIAIPQPIAETDPEAWRQQFDVNVTGAFNAIREFLTFAFRGGLIVNVASTSAHRPSPGWAAYGASKAALVHLGGSVLAEVGHEYDLVTISPGRTATALRRALAPDEDQSLIQQPESVARAIFYALTAWQAQPVTLRRWHAMTIQVANDCMTLPDGHVLGLRE